MTTRCLRFLPALLGAVFLLHLPAHAAGKRKVIIDQDAYGPGGSNLQAIEMLLQAPDVEVLGITIVSGDGWVAENVAHTLRLLELLGRTDVPVVAGSTYPLVNSQEATKRWESLYGKLVYKGAWMENGATDGADKKSLRHGPFVVPPLEEGDPKAKPAPEVAANFLIRKVHEFPGQVTILAGGPFTNLALAQRLDDSFAATAQELVFMGGSFEPQPNGTLFAAEYAHTPRLEFNMRWDPEAAAIVLRSPWKKITQVPVDPTTKTFFSPDMKAKIARVNGPIGAYTAKYGETYPMWDELAVGVWLDPGIITKGQKLLESVDTSFTAGYGNTLSWPLGAGPGLGEQPVLAVMEVDVPRFEALFLRLMTAPAMAPIAK